MKLAWYTATRNGSRGKIIALSGPYCTRAGADGMVAEPGSRDRGLAEALDPRAHFAEFMTVAFRAGARVSTVLADPRAIRALRGMGIEVPA